MCTGVKGIREGVCEQLGELRITWKKSPRWEGHRAVASHVEGDIAADAGR